MTRRYVARIDADDTAAAVGTLGCLGFFIVCFAAWATHIVWVIGKLAGNVGITGGQLLLGLLGSLVPPVGVVHGMMIWFGAGMG